MGDKELEIFSTRLKELRANLGLTQSQFVENLGFTASALSAYEKNDKNPSISVAKRIAEEYHVSIDWLCGLTNYQTGELTLAECISGDMSIKAFMENVVALQARVQHFYLRKAEMKKMVDKKIMDEDLYQEWEKRELEEYNFPITDLFKETNNSPE